jgi:hypothetical protein
MTSSSSDTISSSSHGRWIFRFLILGWEELPAPEKEEEEGMRDKKHKLEWIKGSKT